MSSELVRYSVQDAYDQARQWCEKHPGWKPIAEIDDSDSLYKTWDELSLQEKAPWIKAWGANAQNAFDELATKPCKVDFGFISGAGEFYKKATDIPFAHQLMMVFKVGS